LQKLLVQAPKIPNESYAKVSENKPRKQAKASFLSGFCLLFRTANNKALRLPNMKFEALKIESNF